MNELASTRAEAQAPLSAVHPRAWPAMSSRRLVAAAYLVLVHAALFAAAIQLDIPHRALVRLGVAYPTQSKQAAASIAWARVAHMRMDPSIPAGSVIFLGDSITQGLAVTAVAASAVNFGIGGQTSSELLQALPEYHSIQRAAAVAVLIGTNDLVRHQEDGFEQRLRSILAAVPAGVPIVVSSVPPLRSASAGRVELVVHGAKQACAQRAGCVFLDLHRIVVSAGVGAQEPDGVHLTTAGYAQWISELRSAMVPTAHRDTPISSKASPPGPAT